MSSLEDIRKKIKLKLEEEHKIAASKKVENVAAIKPKDENDNTGGDSGGSKPESDDENEPRFIKKDDKESQEETEAAKKEIKDQEIIESLSNEIRPESNQQRNLDRETGGVEEDKEKGNYTGKDAWDDRSEEVDKMGSTNVFNTTGMRSVVWKQKRERLKSKKQQKEAVKDAAAAVAAAKGSASNAKDFDPNKPFDSRTDFVAPKQGFVSRLKNLRQDHSDDSGRG